MCHFTPKALATLWLSSYAKMPRMTEFWSKKRHSFRVRMPICQMAPTIGAKNITCIIKIAWNLIYVMGCDTLHHENCQEFIWCNRSGLAGRELWWHDAIHCSMEIEPNLFDATQCNKLHHKHQTILICNVFRPNGYFTHARGGGSGVKKVCAGGGAGT